MSKKTKNIVPEDGKKLNFFLRHLDLTIIIITACLLAFTNISLYFFSKSQVKKSAKDIALCKIDHIDSHISDLMARIKTTAGFALEMVTDEFLDALVFLEDRGLVDNWKTLIDDKVWGITAAGRDALKGL